MTEIGTSPSGQMFLRVPHSNRPEMPDTEPYARRQMPNGFTMPMFGADEPGTVPTDHAQHYVAMMHPHLAQHYAFAHTVDEEGDHSLHAFHNVPHDSPADDHDQPVGEDNQRWRVVGELHWSGHQPTEDTVPGEIQRVGVHPGYRGQGIATALWDYANAQAAAGRAPAPVHSDVRSIQGNHWAHFVGGATLPRTAGFGNEEL